MRLPVVITRPLPQAHAWQQALQARLQGSRVCHVLPLIELVPVGGAGQQRLRQCWQTLDAFHAAVFVSPAAVTHFFAAQSFDAARQWQAQGLRAWAVGPGTRRALLAAGVEAAQIDSPPDDARQFDSEALWEQVQPQLTQCRRSGKKILRVRGTEQPPMHNSDAFPEAADAGTGRDWLGHAIQQAGVGLHSVVAYGRQSPVWRPDQAATAAALADAPAVWLFSSSLALRHLADIFPGRKWAHAVALGTHARIAQQIRAQGFGRVWACRPTVDDVAHSLQFCP